MEEYKMSNNYKSAIKQEVSAKLRSYAAGVSNYDEMLDFTK